VRIVTRTSEWDRCRFVLTVIIHCSGCFVEGLALPEHCVAWPLLFLNAFYVVVLGASQLCAGLYVLK
jgi:hypothetical protein